MAEVAWNEGQNFRTVRGKLDKFSTFGGLARFGVIKATAASDQWR